MMKHLPQNHQGVNVGKILDIPAGQLRSIKEITSSLGQQASVDLATYSLSDWETMLGIDKKVPDDIGRRRQKIKSRMASQSQTTKEMILAVAKSLSSGRVELIEYPNDFYFTLDFYGGNALPENMDEFTDYLSKVKPAHLDVRYRNNISCHAGGKANISAGVTFARVFELTEQVDYTVTASNESGGLAGVTLARTFELTDQVDYAIGADGRYNVLSGLTNSAQVELHESYDRNIRAKAKGSVGINIGNTQIITAEG